MFKAIALDLDGTLTNSEKKVSERNKRALQEAIKRGVSIILASGRPTYGMSEVWEALELERLGGYVLSYNGSLCMDCKTKEVLYEHTIPRKYYEAIAKAVREADLGLLSYQGKEIVTERPEFPYMDRESTINKMPFRKVEDFPNALSEEVCKLLALGEHEELLPLKERLEKEYGEELSIFFSEPFFLEICPLGVDKGESLKRLLEKKGWKREELMAFGDGGNDLTMLQYAGKGIAMANSQKHVLEIADEVTLSNDEDGVAVMVEKYILSNI